MSETRPHGKEDGVMTAEDHAYQLLKKLHGEPVRLDHQMALAEAIRAAQDEARREERERLAKMADGKRLNASNWQAYTRTWKESRITDAAKAYAHGGEQMAKDIAAAIRGDST